jgi:hypothetical protein
MTTATQTAISFDVSKEDSKLIRAIVDRAFGPGALGDGMRKYSIKRLDLSMDITATHANGTPLDLQKLFDFDAFNFAHDVIGILRHLDRETGKLGGCFLPRCARNQ